jgi:CcmD family protein
MTIAQVAIDTVASAAQSNQEASSPGIQVVMWVTLIVWGGLFAYLFYLDRQVKKIKNKIDIEQS